MIKTFYILIFLISNHAYGQIMENKCDPTILSSEEYKKCQLDSVYLPDINYKINFISKFKTEVLPIYKENRKKLVLPETLKNNIDELKQVYDSVLIQKAFSLLKTSDSSLLYVQPKAYLSSLLSLELLKIYPQVQGVLLNEIHVLLKPKTSMQELKRYRNMVDTIIKSIPKELELEISVSATELSDFIIKNKENFIFLGQPGERLKELNLVDYLLWTE